MPWLFAYSFNAKDLAELGYRPVLERTDTQKKEGQKPLTFVLFGRARKGL